MTEQEAIELLQNLNVKLTDMSGHKTNGIEKIFGWNEITAICEAINALEEVQKYRAIGTPKEIKQKLEELERWHTYRLAINVKNPFAKMSTSICHNCDHKDEYIEELEVEVQQYRAIGTPEECRAAVEKQIAKKPIIEYEHTHDCVTEIEWKCPTCEANYIELAPCGEWCRYCGTKLDWSEEE